VPFAEKALIEQLRRRARRGGHLVRLGIGDDCAILRIAPGCELLVTTDLTIEGTHFRREWIPAESVGHRCLARGLSDIAAMGGDPVAAFLSLGLPRKLPQAWVNRFMEGLLKLADRFGVTLAGGDVSESRDRVFADIMVVGSVPHNAAVSRAGARSGDKIYVTGALGGSSGALDELLSSRRRKLSPKEYPRFFNPVPRMEVGRFLRGKNLASSMIDLSDGLSTDLGHICEESKVGAKIQSGALPLAKIGRSRRKVDLRLALHGGEDYELLFTAPADKRVPVNIGRVPITEIGYITRRKRVVLLNEDDAASELKAAGWEHFRR